jgi:hypothetical protein
MGHAVAAWLLIALLWIPRTVLADPVENLRGVSEHAIEGMHGGNLSGLVECSGALWAVSDRDDDLLYRLSPSQAPVWQAQAQPIEVPSAPPSGLSWRIRLMVWLGQFVRGGELDFEGVSCDAKGNRYLLSEGHAAVLQVPVQGPPRWLAIEPAMVREARARGLMFKVNAIAEGLAVDPSGQRLWLAAEREQRGLLQVFRQPPDVWRCAGRCVLLAEEGRVIAPAALNTRRRLPIDFADLAFFDGKLFTLERNAHRICRRDTRDGQVERCWSFADVVLAPGRRYAEKYGLFEALAVDRHGAWLGVDNNEMPREDGERRPVVWRVAAPAAGWSAP